MEFLIRLVQVHESFRKAEIHACAKLAGVEVEVVHYSEYVGLYLYLFLPFPVDVPLDLRI